MPGACVSFYMTGADLKTEFKFLQGHKLKKKNEFLLCYRQGKRYLTFNFILFVYNRGPDNLGFRLGTAVTKKIGKAVYRNRIKRVIREFFRLHQHRVYLDLDFVVVPKKRIKPAQVDYWQVEREISPALTRIQQDFSPGTDRD